MPALNRDLDILEHILRYCRQIETAHQDFGFDRKRFDQSTTYQNAVAMCILQIGELVNRLTAEFKNGTCTDSMAQNSRHAQLCRT